MKLNNILYTVNNSLCTGCGVCSDVCPTESISIIIKNGVHVPSVNKSSCLNTKGCNKCFQSCTGKGMEIQAFSNELFKNCLYDYYIGFYKSLYSGFSNDYDIRYHSASGGLLTQMLIYMLENNIISGAVVTVYDKKNALLFRPTIATSVEEIKSARSSKYTHISFDGILNQIRQTEGKFVIVGLPCHIQAFRKIADKDTNFKSKVLGYFGLYCSSGRSFSMTEYIFKNNKIDKSTLKYFAYRDEGCLGSLIASDAESNVKLRFQSYYQPLRSIFVPKRCLLCTDYFAELADISFGDLHIEPFSNDKIGTNSIIIRSDFFQKILDEMIQKNIITITELEKDILLKAQSSVKLKKHRAPNFIKILKLLHKKVPIYDQNYKSCNLIKAVIAYIHTSVQIFIGKNKFLWPIIRFIRKKENFD